MERLDQAVLLIESALARLRAAQAGRQRCGAAGHGERGGALARRPLLVAISGIDGSGKGTIAAALAGALRRRARSTALIGLDPWHRRARERFSEVDPAGHFYREAFRFDDLFRLVIDPLLRGGSLSTRVTLLDPAKDARYRARLAFSRVEVVLLEGIFLFREPWRRRYDLSLWVACSFEEALKRAVRRNQEGLSGAALRRDYRRVYFPAQRIHMRLDTPRTFADATLLNGRGHRLLSPAIYRGAAK